ncbi:chemotaxis protein CheB [Schlesneria paludicola]|uniref:chemotaxis protein CheB n=1 Tax=Schlesneria paludicola TaxID=360056 RepID=UPI00192C3709|nr:chemotaxis protein CheB [Schlesneria paludicola]
MTADTSSIAAPPQVDGSTIVGIGASAGGLEALELFFKSVPVASGFAFVVVQHLDPTHKAALVQLIQRSTPMPVVEIEDQMRVEKDHIYVIPPNRDLSIFSGRLHLLEPAERRGLRLPIDFFFRSLAQDQKERSVGVILSGMGSDGTLGLRAIKEMGGTVFAQAPGSAKFDSMPRSAIDAGFCDVIAAAEELGPKLVAVLRHLPGSRNSADLSVRDADRVGLDKVIVLLREQTGQDFSQYKKTTIYRRIERRMGLHQLIGINDYVRYLRNNPQEVTLLFKELLIGVTSFFRDPPMWEQLKEEILPALVAGQPQGGQIRAWTAGCSTGEEAYTLAMIFYEVLDAASPPVPLTLQIFATDLDKDAIDRARAGIFPDNIVAHVSEERLQKFFERDDRGYRIRGDIREMVIFAPQNMTMDPPFTRLDLVICRNVLIYLEPKLQKELLQLFHYCLNPRGILVLGNSETVAQCPDLFDSHAGKTRIYRRLDDLMRTSRVELPSTFGRVRTTSVATSNAPAPVTNLQTLADSLMLSSYCSPAVLTTASGDITYFGGKVGKYLEPAAGKANLSIFAMVRKRLGGALHAAFAKSVREKIPVTMSDVLLEADGREQSVKITVQPVMQPSELRELFLVLFADIDGVIRDQPGSQVEQVWAYADRIAELTEEVQQARSELQAAHEEMQTSQEELKSANEELQSTNEELQSTNEELTTSKEEMQSMNEELQTLNQELQAKVDELSEASDDMKNLLNNTEIAILFLDNNLKVRRFTNQTTRIIKLIPSDAGRSITDLVSVLDYPTMAQDVNDVLRTLCFHECQATTNDGRWFTVRIMPYRAHDNRIDGVVVTFVDISDSKKLEMTLRQTLAALQDRCSGQTIELETAKTLELLIQQAQVVLNKKLTDQSIELSVLKADLNTNKKNQP